MYKGFSRYRSVRGSRVDPPRTLTQLEEFHSSILDLELGPKGSPVYSKRLGTIKPEAS